MFITQFAAALIDVSIYLKHSRVDLLILAVKDVLDELHVICPHSHLEEAENGTVSNVDFSYMMIIDDFQSRVITSQVPQLPEVITVKYFFPTFTHF